MCIRDSNMPVFRPVIAFDKNEIIEIAEKIDTFETSIQPFEDCCTIFVAKHPVTKPDICLLYTSINTWYKQLWKVIWQVYFSLYNESG